MPLQLVSLADRPSLCRPVSLLILLILALTYDPCIINALVSFDKEQISTAQLTMLKQYQPIETAPGFKMAHY